MEPDASSCSDSTSTKADVVQAPSVNAVVEVLVQAASQSPRVLGTHLGSAVKAKFPTFDIKTQFGGLRRFIAAHCSDQIKWIEKRGGDDVYAHVATADSHGFAASGGTAATTPASAWASFTNPNYSQLVAVDKSRGELTVVSPQEAVPSEAVIVPKATAEEHRAIAQDFVSMIPAEFRAPFEQALSQPYYWPTWQQGLQTLKGSPHYSNWLRTRADKLTTLFRERLSVLGISEGSVSVAAAQLQQSRTAARQLSLTAARPNTPSATAPHVPQNAPQLPANSVLREIAMSSVSRMADDDLRRLWLPLGAVIDALRGQR